MSTIVLRSVKNSPLTNAEVDANFSNLNTDKLEAATSATLTNKTINLTSNTLVATSAQLAAAVTDETGTGALVFANSPTLVTPALGTPASGVVTNLTGTASININGTVGATTASTGAFTTLTTSSTVTHNGGTANGVAFLNSSKVLTTGSALTFDGTNLGVLSAGLNVGDGTTTLRSVASGGVGLFGTSTDHPLAFRVNNTEQMRLTSTGLGIWTSSPDARLSVNGAASFSDGTAAAPAITNIGDLNTGIFFPAADTIAFAEGGVEAMRLDSSGNLGLGVTPSAWSANNQSLEGPYGAVSLGTSLGTVLSAGAYYNSGWKYKSNGTARILLMDSNSFQFYNAPSGTAGNAISFSQVMTLNASGNLGIGTSSPGARLNVVGADIATIAIIGGVTRGLRVGANSALAYIEGVDNTGTASYQPLGLGGSDIRFSIGGTGSERMRLDSSGNLGLGVTPSGWATSFKAMQLGAGGFISGRTNTDEVYVGANCFFDNTDNRWEYIATDVATQYYQDAGTHVWRIAPSGTAGNAISFSQVMTLDASGRLGIGLTSPIDTLQVNGGITVGSDSTPTARSRIFESFGLNIESGAAGGGRPIIFGTNNTERARIDSSGNLLVNGTTSLGSGARVQVINPAGGSLGFSTGYSSTAGQFRQIYLWSADNSLRFDNGLNIGSLSSAGAWVNSSDARLKKNITSIKYGLADVLKTQPRSYEMINVSGEYIGFIAQEIQTIIPEVVSGDPEKQLGVDYGSLVALAFKAIQEQQALIQTLTARVAALESI